MQSATGKSQRGEALTIGRLGRAAGVGVETIRYYQRRGLLPVPVTPGGCRRYAPELADRIRFIKRAQALGFSLEEIRELLQLNDGTNRKSIRALASRHLQQVRRSVTDLRRMERALKTMLEQCEHTALDQPCPIIETLSEDRGR